MDLNLPGVAVSGDTPIFLFVDWHRFPGQELEEPRRFCARWRREAPAESYGWAFAFSAALPDGSVVIPRAERVREGAE